MWQEFKRVGWANVVMLVLLCVAAGLSFVARAQDSDVDDLGLLAPPPAATESELAEQIETLQQSLVKLNRDLFILEEDLLFPSSTQVVVYLSMDVGTYFDLDSVEIKIGDETVTHYLYTAKQVDALVRGGVHRVYIGNIGQGEHELSAFFHGTGPEERPYKRGVTLAFEKTDDPSAIELQIVDSTMAQQPEFIATAL
ncbi:hypothetical protein QTP81_15585 [Alteromonas sp. ASW11-36]|uniref:AraC family transcriptional regulator n=1 Tax=Alteromonas arenosi TaxID=3055817 RepID=A0ABT7T0R7_9ALTE|nr:hypothetical protein [Alteromonas sp. ASW11-36]MDM7862025.1 hypothetical protein [Alteromonas sp. ASW11-36]